jgi:hypothetical protein
VPVLLADVESVVVVAAVALFEIVEPLAALAFTFTTIVKTAVSPAATVLFENTTLPVPPTAGVLPAHPVPVVTEDETNVVPAGTASVTVTLCASLGPLFTKLIV